MFTETPCANVFPCVPGGPTVNCDKKAKRVCECNLVAYCGKTCQRAHWDRHKRDCEGSLRQQTWTPDWIRENRNPEFRPVAGQIQAIPQEKASYIIGNTAAIDVLQLQKNEGKRYEKDLQICFAASGDIRCLVETILGVPQSYPGKLDITLNDMDGYVATRNATLLIIAASGDEIEVTVDAVTHLWLSGRISPKIARLLEREVKPFIDSVLMFARDKSDKALLSKTLYFGDGSLEVEFTKQQWVAWSKFISRKLSLAVYENSRITETTKEKDIRQAHYWKINEDLSFRASCDKYYRTGMFLPFGADDKEFTLPNPIFYSGTSTRCLLIKSTDPLQAWSLKDATESAEGLSLPSSDYFGLYYIHVQRKLSAFYLRIREMQCNIRVMAVSAHKLKDHFDSTPRFDRIDTSNIADAHFLGPSRTIEAMAPLLNPANPYATLILFFMNAATDFPEHSKPQILYEGRQKAAQYLGISNTGANIGPRMNLRVNSTAMWFFPVKDVFKRFMDTWQFNSLFRRYGLRMLDQHSITSKWPVTLKKRRNEPGAMQEVEWGIVKGGISGFRYMELRRAN